MIKRLVCKRLHCVCSKGLQILFAMIICSESLLAEEPSSNLEADSYSPYIEKTCPQNVYWGDTHLHTNLSVDAYNFGNKQLGPADAYLFAKGEAVTASNGMQVRLRRSLDFLVIADHASNMGVMNGLATKDIAFLSSPLAKEWVSKINEIDKIASIDIAKSTALSNQLIGDGFMKDSVSEESYRHSVWRRATLLAEKYNDPGQFTALIGYEWTQVFNNLYRVVIFKDSAEKASQVIPFSQYDSADPEA